jgi:hypothetical protein
MFIRDGLVAVAFSCGLFVAVASEAGAPAHEQILFAFFLF